MRNSQRALVAAYCFVVAVMVVFAVWFRLVAEPMPKLSGERTSRTFDLRDFDRVEMRGQWQVTIERGDAWRVAVEVPAEIVDEIDARVLGDRLSLSLEGGWCAGCFREGLALEATITMPALESLDMEGAANASFAGFDGPALSLELSGAGALRGTQSRFDSLSLDMSGAASIDLSEVPVTDAAVDVSGTGNVKLRMAGGHLTGDMSGATNLEYSGSVSAETVDRSGISNVRHRD